MSATHMGITSRPAYLCHFCESVPRRSGGVSKLNVIGRRANHIAHWIPNVFWGPPAGRAPAQAPSNSGTIRIPGTVTSPLSVIRISGMTDRGMRLKPM